MMQMISSAPTAKVSAATIAAALTSLILWGLKTYLIKDGSDIPEPVQYALFVVVTAGVTFLAGYYKAPHPQDIITEPGAPKADPNGHPTPLAPPPADPPTPTPPGGTP